MEYDRVLIMEIIPTEERRLYEISYTIDGAREENEHVPRELRDSIEKQGGIIQDDQPPKKYRDSWRGFIHVIAAPSFAARIEAAIRSLPFLTRVIFVRWEKTAPHTRDHAFMRKPIAPQKEEDSRARAIDKQLDELLEKQL